MVGCFGPALGDMSCLFEAAYHLKAGRQSGRQEHMYFHVVTRSYFTAVCGGTV